MNQNKELLFFGSGEHLKVFYFKNNTMKFIQRLLGHQTLITVLNFFVKNKNVISGSEDSSLILWPASLISNRKFIIKLKGHKSIINCIVLTPKVEDQIFSGSDDNTIKIWSQSSQKWCRTQTFNQHHQSVQSMSINNERNKLISCSSQSQNILIMERSNGLHWQIAQQMKTYQEGASLAFITNNMFVYQPLLGTHLLLYTFNNKQHKFTQQRAIPIQKDISSCSSPYPAIYSEKKNILVFKHGDYIDVLRIRPISEIDCECYLLQTIQFENAPWMFGTINDSGDFLITWDSNSEKIQIRKYTELRRKWNKNSSIF
ncbi:unnamed protein product [Paramecium sonneborni]|uniref:Uncharacterized protein n=1 Tax=Paramecium sonneborni TaxID=65129 RepID=A0A8S1RP49_9CILI|nr:unnamed protein product [Paramecium sonneborni]